MNVLAKGDFLELGLVCLDWISITRSCQRFKGLCRLPVVQILCIAIGSRGIGL